MANLPPKVPNVTGQDPHRQRQQWQEFLHPQNNQDNQQSQNPPWVEEFIEFSTAKRGAHRRTLSDSSVGFAEAGAVPLLGRPPDLLEKGKNNNEDEFDKFDDEQFMSMFSNELGRSLSNPSSTSDHNSTNEDQKTDIEEKRVDGGERAEEVESSPEFDKDEGQGQPQGGGKRGYTKCGNVAASGSAGGGTNMGGVDQQGQQPAVDPKRVKRILANRQSAQRSRVRKLQYISELERSVTALQSEVSALSPRVAFLDHQRMILNVDNSTLKSKIAALAQDKIFKDAHQEAMKREIERLRQVYYQHNLNKTTTDSVIPPPSSSSLPPPSQHPPSDCTAHENDHLNG